MYRFQEFFSGNRTSWESMDGQNLTESAGKCHTNDSFTGFSEEKVTQIFFEINVAKFGKFKAIEVKV